MRLSKPSLWQALVVYLAILSLCSTTDIGALFSQDSLTFYIKLTSVGYTNASFKIVDDNTTPTNYIINYKIENAPTKYQETNTNLIIEKDRLENSLEIQTNSIVAGSNGLDLLFWSNGNQLTDEEVKAIKAKTTLEQHTVTIDSLEEDRVYDISFTIIGSLAQSKVFKTAKFFDSKRSVKNFHIQFRTHLDVRQEAEAACLAATNAEKDGLIEVLKKSCYQIGSNCTKCNPDCYLVKGSTPVAGEAVLCRKCPCDSTRSSGVCTVKYESTEVSHVDNLADQPIFTCTGCVKPYTGLTCDECEREGFDFYKNIQGECVKCVCSGNSLYDNSDFNSHVGENQRRKCAPVTGECVECMFNTTGKTCNECMKGFHGDPLKRTCKPMHPHASDDSLSPATIDISQYQYSSKKFMFYYLLSLVLLALVVYISVSRYRNSNEAEILKTFTNCFTSINNGTRDIFHRLASYFCALCPRQFKSQGVSTIRINNVMGRNTENSATNDDDRLNLAEYQVYDENALFEADPSRRPEYNSDTEDIMNSRKNPYQELTLKC